MGRKAQGAMIWTGVRLPTFPPHAVMRYLRIDFMNCRGRTGLTALPAAKSAERRTSLILIGLGFRIEGRKALTLAGTLQEHLRG